MTKCPQTNVLMVGNDPSVKGGMTSVIVQLLSYDWDAHGIHMSFIPTYIEGNPVRKVLFFAKSLLHIRKQLKRFNPHRPDIVHIHMSYRGSFVRARIIHQMCKCANVPDIVHMHGSEFSKWFSSCREKKQRQIREFLSEVNRVIVLGDSWKKRIQSIEPDTTIQVVHNSVKIPELDKINQWNNTTFQVLYMGVLIKRRGVSDLLDAVAMLRDDNLLGNMRFIVAGTGSEEVLLKDKVKKSNLEDVVHFTGWVNGDEKALLYQESQAFVLPSYNEGLPVAVLEAISYGLPVISTDIGDIQAAVHDGENGIIITPGDISALVDALNGIHQSSKEPKEHGRSKKRRKRSR